MCAFLFNSSSVRFRVGDPYACTSVNQTCELLRMYPLLVKPIIHIYAILFFIYVHLNYDYWYFICSDQTVSARLTYRHSNENSVLRWQRNRYTEIKHFALQLFHWLFIFLVISVCLLQEHNVMCWDSLFFLSSQQVHICPIAMFTNCILVKYNSQKYRDSATETTKVTVCFVQSMWTWLSIKIHDQQS